MNTITISSPISVVTKSTRGRKFEAAKWAMKRAWDISRNAAVAHNTNPLSVLKIGLVKPSEYFQESLKLAWKEAKAKINRTPYEAYKMHNVPKKSVPSILNAIAKFAVVRNLGYSKQKDDMHTVINKSSKFSFAYRKELSEIVLETRFSTPASRSNNKDFIDTYNRFSQSYNIVLN